MTEQEYTHTTEEVKADYLNMQAFLADDSDTEANYRAVMQWSRWIAERDRQVAERAWDQGFKAGWAECNDPGPFVNDVWDAKTPNPHRKQAPND